MNTVKNDDNANLIINGGKFTNNYQVAVMNWNIATINGGVFDTPTGNDKTNLFVGSFGKEGVNKGILTINGGTFNAEYTFEGVFTKPVTVAGGVFNYTKGLINPRTETYANESQGILPISKDGISVTAGTFNTKIDSRYIANGYIINEKNSKYVVELPIKDADVPVIDLNKEVNEIKTGVVDFKTTEKILVNALETSKIDTTGKNATVLLSVQNVDEKLVNQKTLEDMNKLLNSKYKDAKIAGYIEINLNVVNKDDSSDILGKLTELDKKITLNIVLPKSLKDVKPGYKRVYYVIRNHNGNIEILDTKVSDDLNNLSFETDKFSTYALAYNDEQIDEITNPNTYDSGIVGYIGLAIVSLIGLVVIAISYKRKFIINK